MSENQWPLPEDPALAAYARTIEKHGLAAEIWDGQWRLAYHSTEYRVISNAGRDFDTSAVRGAHFFSPEMAAARDSWPTTATPESFLAGIRETANYIVAASTRGADDLRSVVDTRYRDLVDAAKAASPPPAWGTHVDIKFGAGTIGNDVILLRVQRDDGAIAGFVVLVKPQLRAGVLGMLALGDTRVFERMSGLVDATRRPAAVLFADLENSTPLAKRMATAAYFALLRRMATLGDRAIIEAGGLVGKHAGDGLTAFFLVTEIGSESGAARACIESMRALRQAARYAGERSGLNDGDVTMRFGLHWGDTLYVGRMVTSGRIEVTALGDDVNETARIEACATGGRALASKALMERLSLEDARALGLSTAQISYAALAELASATDKARRDAPAIAVCEL